MIELKLIPAAPEEMRSLIEYAYDGDTDLIEKYQAGDRSFEECVDFNYNEIRDKQKEIGPDGGMKLWKISLQSEDEISDIGYCVTIAKENELRWLFSCAINKHYRKSVFLKDWLRKLEEEIGAPYFIALWNKNSRAIDFFVKNGFVKKMSANEQFWYLFKGYDMIPQKQRELWQFQ